MYGKNCNFKEKKLFLDSLSKSCPLFAYSRKRRMRRAQSTFTRFISYEIRSTNPLLRAQNGAATKKPGPVKHALHIFSRRTYEDASPGRLIRPLYTCNYIFQLGTATKPLRGRKSRPSIFHVRFNPIKDPPFLSLAPLARPPRVIKAGIEMRTFLRNQKLYQQGERRHGGLGAPVFGTRGEGASRETDVPNYDFNGTLPAVLMLFIRNLL